MSVTEGANVRSFTHDGAGNITADDRGGAVYNYRYNNRGRLDRLTIGSTVTADYVYDALERLAIRATQNMTPAGTTHYVYDRGGRLIAEAHDTGQTAREYVWLDDMPLAVIADVDTASPQLLFVHADHLDRPLKMTDGSQALLWDAVFLPFGEAQSVTTALNLRFPGQYFLIESGLHYNWHRHYDPTTGRYLQPDPLGFVDGPSVYAYALSAPTTTIDPLGGSALRGMLYERRQMGPEMGGSRGGGGSSFRGSALNCPLPGTTPHHTGPGSTWVNVRGTGDPVNTFQKFVQPGSVRDLGGREARW